MKPTQLIGSRDELLKVGTAVLAGQADPGSPFQTQKGFSFYSNGHFCCWFSGILYPRDLVDNPCNEPARYVVDKVTDHGIPVLDTFDGSFLLCLWGPDACLFQRDYFGSGPQLYFTDQYFATQQSALAAHMESLQPDWKAMAGFLKFGYIPSPGSGLLGMRKLPPARRLFVSREGFCLQEVEAYSLRYMPEIHRLSLEDAKEKYQELHQQAIKKRILGVKQIGMLLSGGYDSAGNMAGLRAVYDGPLKACTVGFKDNPWSEVPLARKMADTFQADLEEVLIDGTELNELPQLIHSLGDPFQEGGLMVNYKALKNVSQMDVDVVLGGDGNDQHFGTAGRELALHFLTRRSGLFLLQKVLHTMLERNAANRDTRLYKLFFHNRKILNVLMNDAFGFSSGMIRQMTGHIPTNQAYGDNRVKGIYRSFDHLFYAHQHAVDLEQVIREVILFKAGQVSGMQGVRMAFPYMDLELAEWLPHLPRSMRLSGQWIDLVKGHGSGKFIHKQVYQDALPSEITDRKKQGGFAPLASFFSTPEAVDQVRMILRISSIHQAGFNKAPADLFLNQYDELIKKPTYWFWFRQVQSFKLFNLLVLLLWWENLQSPGQIKHLTDLTNG